MTATAYLSSPLGLLSLTGTTTTITYTVGTRTMPCHTNKQGAVMPKVCWPPILRVGHKSMKVFFYSFQIEAFKSFGIVEIFGHWVG